MQWLASLLPVQTSLAITMAARQSFDLVRAGCDRVSVRTHTCHLQSSKGLCKGGGQFMKVAIAKISQTHNR